MVMAATKIKWLVFVSTEPPKSAHRVRTRLWAKGIPSNQWRYSQLPTWSSRANRTNEISSWSVSPRATDRCRRRCDCEEEKVARYCSSGHTSQTCHRLNNRVEWLRACVLEAHRLIHPGSVHQHGLLLGVPACSFLSRKQANMLAANNWPFILMACLYC